MLPFVKTHTIPKFFKVYVCVVIISLTMTYSLRAQGNYPTLPENAPVVVQLVPTDWIVIAEANGDLDGDGREDYCFVVELKDPNHLESGLNAKRILGIYLKEKDGGYTKALQSNTFIISKDREDMNEPLQGINVNDEHLEVYFQLWYGDSKWLVSDYMYRFELGRKNALELVSLNQTETNRQSAETKEAFFDFKSNKAHINSYNLKTNEVITDKEEKIDSKDMLTIETLGLPFKREMMGVYI